MHLVTSNQKRTIRALIQKYHGKKENINQNLAKRRGYIPTTEKFCQGADEMKYFAVNFSEVGWSESRQK